MSTTEHTAPAPLRVLVVENDPEWRQDHIENLRSWGYEAYAAETAEQATDRFRALWDDAIAKARHLRCQLALVDMRLKSDYNPNDTSGLDLVPFLAPTVSLIVSGYGDAKTVRAALTSRLAVPQRAYDFVGKEDGPEALRKVIEEVQRLIWCRRDVDFARPDELQSAALVKRFFPQDESVPSDEVDDVLRRLFPRAKRLKIESAGISQRTSGLLLRRRSAVVKILKDDDMQLVIVKLARSGRVKEEINRFDEARKQLTAWRYAAPIGDPIELWDVGGIVYQFIGEDQNYPVVSFSEYYATHGPDEIGHAMTNFERFWHHLYQVQPSAPRSKKETLFTAYNRVWGDEWCDRLLKYQAHPLLGEYPDPLSRLGLPNPIAWLIKKAQLVGAGLYNDGGMPDTIVAMTHGDLHGDNFFVDTRHDVWVIDYERTGFGPILQDWVELENDILTLLAELDIAHWSQFCILIRDLLTPKTILLPSNTRAVYGKFDKEWQTIGRLRELAVESSSTNDGRQYLWGLLLNSLFRLTLLLKERDEWVTETSQDSVQDEELRSRRIRAIQRCLSLAGMVCHRLDHWNKSWPPEKWSQISSIAGKNAPSMQESSTPSRPCVAQLSDPLSSQWPDFVLVTALAEERDAVLNELPGYRKLPPSEADIAACYQADLPVVFPDDRSGMYRVVVVPLLGMGRVKAATLTATTLLRWHPRYVILIGIAGGIAAGGVRIGDILVSDQIVDYELQKHTAEGEKIRWEVYRADPRLLNAIQNFAIENWDERVQTKRPTRGKPKLHIGPIASGDKVIAFAAVLERYREVWPKLIGVEMEAAGVATAAFQSPERPGFFMIRCVSDLADEHKDSRRVERWRPYACDAAASFAIALLKSGPVPLTEWRMQ